MLRTLLLAAAAAALALTAASDTALAQFYRGKTVTMIVNYPPGGPTDIEGRIVAQHLPNHIPGKPTVIVRNVGGAGGIIGTNQLGEASPNGDIIGFFTLDMVAEFVGNPSLRTHYADFVDDRRRREPAGGLCPQGHAARPQGRDRHHEGQGLQGAVAQRAEQQHRQPDAGARHPRPQVSGDPGLSRA